MKQITFGIPVMKMNNYKTGLSFFYFTQRTRILIISKVHVQNYINLETGIIKDLNIPL